MRQTADVKGYGYVTGDRIFDAVLEAIKTVPSTRTFQDSLSEVVKAASKSAVTS